MGATEAGLQLEEEKRGRVITDMERYAPRFITQVVSTRTDYVKEHPDRVDRFLKGLFATVAFVKANKAKTGEITTRVLHQSRTVMDRTYDSEVSMLSDDGTFDLPSIEILKESYIEMGVLDKKPGNDQLFTTQFLPVKP
jgi:ABC-type nitrate/sulfonate/bicarbonate transport system substrate-binding protein